MAVLPVPAIPGFEEFKKPPDCCFSQMVVQNNGKGCICEKNGAPRSPVFFACLPLTCFSPGGCLFLAVFANGWVFIPQLLRA